MKDALKKIVPAEAFVKTEEKIDHSFACGYGTVLFFEDQKVVKGLQEAFPAYQENFPGWSLQTSAMHHVKDALLRERDKKSRNRKKFIVDGYTDFVFLNNNGQVYTQSFIYDAIQGITTSYNKEEYAKALEENRQPRYLPKISAHILRHTFCTRMCESDVNIKVLQDIMGHRNIRTTMETYAKAMKDKKVETIQALNGAFKIS